MLRLRWLALPLLLTACGRTEPDDDDYTLLHQDGGHLPPVSDAGTDAPFDADAAVDAPADALADAPDADAAVDAPLDAETDAPLDAELDAPTDAPLDADADAPPECVSDADCADAFACTQDSCAVGGVCVHAPNDAACDDGLFCTGTESCNPSLGCVTAKLFCNDGVPCTIDTCDEATKSCVSTPNDALCPVSHKCDAVEGCYALAYAHDQATLFEVRLPSGEVKPIGPLGAPSITDVALHPDGTLYAISFSALYTVDPATGKATPKMATSSQGVNALDAAPDGTLYAGGGGTLFHVDTATGAFLPIASYPAGTESSGDLAFVGGRLLASAKTNGTDTLVEIHPDTGASTTLGDIGFACVWGLAAYGPTLYGLTCNGEVLSIDPDAGKGTLLTKVGVQFWGASAR